MGFRVVTVTDIQARPLLPRVHLIHKVRTKSIVGMWRSQPERDNVLTGMGKSFPAQYGAAFALCRRGADGELEVAFFPTDLVLPECYRNEFETLASAVAPEAKSGI